MAELIAQGTRPDDYWKRPLPPDRPVILGRQGADLEAPWEGFLSRRHAELVWRDGRLDVRRLPTARNPVIARGREADALVLRPGETFVVGTTSFTLFERPDTPVTETRDLLEATVSAPELQQLAFRDAPHRLDVLSRLPDVISGTANDVELFPRLAHMLLAGIPRADVVAVVAAPPSDDDSPATVLYWERRLATAGDFHPSEHLIREALERQRQTVLNVWGGQGAGPARCCEWAFCTPVGLPAGRPADAAEESGEAWAGWGIYVVGQTDPGRVATLHGPLEHSDLGDDLKFAELVAAILGSLRQVQALQRRQASLSQFFSPAVLKTLADGDPDVVLRPREADLTVLFCDLRGFSREAERHAADLAALLQRVSQALGVMTQNILDQGGVIGDFHGDAAMGFWGWPLAQLDAPERACHAALAIRTFFEAVGRKPDHPLSGFRAGIGIASGRAVAGKIGTVNQVKVTVFGPVVNLASRLEGMTKTLRAPILLDEATARLVRERIDRMGRLARWRRVARVKPYGLDTPLTVTELLPPAAEYPELTDPHLADYESALDAFTAGDWDRAYDLLRRMPPGDRVPDFLTALIVRRDRKPPPGWNGVVELDSKT